MKIVHKILISLAWLGLPTLSVAQLLPPFTQYREYSSIINPASINSDYFLDDYHISLGLSSRTQWLGIARNPKTSLIRGEYFHKRYRAKFHLITGGWLFHDQTGPLSTTNLNARIAVLGSSAPQEGGFCTGLSIGGGQFRLDALSIDFKDKSDIVQNITQWYPNIGLGIYAYKALSDRNNYVYGGLSMPQLYTLDLSFQNANGDYSVERLQHYYGTIGFCQFPTDRSFWEASSWIKYVPNEPVQLDFNMRYRLKGAFWLGLGFATSKNLHAEMGYMIESKRHAIKIGYGYDSSINYNTSYFGASHEINVAVLIGR